MSQMLPILLAAAACLHGIVTVKAEHCKDYETQFERVFTVPGDAAVLNCTLASPDVFDLNSTQYNISWYECKTGRELSGEGGQFRVRETSLWLLNSTLEDAGQYECILRTPNGCFKQKSVLRVDPAKAGDCRRPHMAVQSLTTIANGYLVCPLNTYMSLVDSYSIQWYKECEPVVEGDKFSLMRENKLLLRHVVANDTGHYTCRMTFNLTGTIGHAAETIECNIKDDWNMRPIVYQPMNETVKADYGV